MSRIFTVHQLDFDGDTENSTNDIIEACRKAELDEEPLTFKMMTPAAYFAACLRLDKDLKCAQRYWCDRAQKLMLAFRESAASINIVFEENVEDHWELVIGYAQAMKFDDVSASFYELRLLSEEKVDFAPNVDAKELLISHEGDGHLLKLTRRQLESTQEQLEKYFFEYQAAEYKAQQLEEKCRKSHNRAEDLKRQKNQLLKEFNALKSREISSMRPSKAKHRPIVFKSAVKHLMRLISRITGRQKNRNRKSLQEVRLIQMSSYFDESFYLSQYPDVKTSPVSPAEHYLRFGGFEGRNPSEKFDSESYLNANKDVKQQGINPLLHYERYGRDELRPLGVKVK